jgi:uncharacterized protein
VFGFSIRRAIGTSLVIVGAVSLAALAAHLAAGNSIDGAFAAPMAVACVAGATAAGRLGPRLSNEALARGFAMLVVFAAAYLLAATAFLGGAQAG